MKATAATPMPSTSKLVARLRQALRLQTLVAPVAAAAVIVALWTIPGMRTSPSQLGLTVVLMVMATVATQFPLLVTPKVKVNTSSAAYFGAALILDPGGAVVVAGLSQLAGGLMLARRRNPLTGRPRRRFIDTAINTSQWMLAVAAAALTFRRVAGSDVSQESYVWFVALLASACVMYLINTGLVAVAAAVQRNSNILEIWLVGRRVDLVTEAGLYVIGAVTSVAAPNHPWVLLGLVLPTVLLHHALNRTLQLERQTAAALEQIADLVDLRDCYTGRHSERVAQLAEQIARRLKLSSEYVATIRLAARVHDIGKIAVPDRILHKPRRLDKDESALMRSHVEAGCNVLERFADYRSGVELVRCHHERIDGSGYPRGLKGEHIPLGAQLIGIADAIDAMTSDRPYRASMPLAVACEELRHEAGSHFSPEVVEAALEVIGGVRDAVPAGRFQARPAMT